jgi:phosphatidylserine/phosphatidylglycerophosphate/cardiolipin synthase-like enzyme
MFSALLLLIFAFFHLIILVGYSLINNEVRLKMLKSKYTGVFVLMCLSLLVSPINAASYPAAGTVDVYFSPDGGCTDAIAKELNNAKSEILVQAYSFTSAPIAKALVNAKKRGVNITVVLDRSQRSAKYSSADFVANSGIPTFIDDRHAIAHNKIIIVDRNVLIAGSFNFTKAAEEKNAENLLIMKGNKQLVNAYIRNFNEHKGHSEAYVGRMSR